MAHPCLIASIIATVAVLVSCSGSEAPRASQYSVVDLQSVSNATKVAVSAAAGLLNRQRATVYTVWTAYDVAWQSRLTPNATYEMIDAEAFLVEALQSFRAIVYDPSEMHSLPAVMTLAGVLDAVPLSLELALQFSNASVVFNATNAWSSQLASLEFVASIALNQTTTVAFQRQSDLVQGYLVDFIVSRRLFVQYMTDGCIPGTQENAFLKHLVAASPWPRPIRVYGYNGLDVLFGGDMFEAETDCINTMGQVATENAANLAFWTTVAPFPAGASLLQRPADPISYSSTKSYVALVYGDMDNIDFVQTFGSDHMTYRWTHCARAARTAAPTNGSLCFPLTWTLSPNLIDFSPQMMRWYFELGYDTGRDWFIMPPSGTLYAYPGMMDNATQTSYVFDQTAQARVMNTSGSVHWEWFFAWDGAWDGYFPKYTTVEGSTTRSFFLNDVPWPVPIPDMWFAGETYRFVGNASDPNAVVGFRPAFNWQEGAPGGGNPGNASAIANMINQLEIGSVQYVYVIQNTDVAHLFDMVTMLAPHVELVSYEQLTSLARQRELRR